ncbi:MAG: hypothetical protein FWC39_12615, partial [Bacteroidetes bacterium]|nr:hypothetical protein [Bacteroidota bacterium]
MSNISFFTDLDLFQSSTQNSDQAFGPVVDSEIAKYRVSSLHSVNVDIENLDELLKAYAVCKGKVAIQPVDGHEDIINLILKPEEHVLKITEINFVPIRYIIYKGILKESLLDSKDEIQMDNKYCSALLERINSDDSSERALGYDSQKDGNISIDELFYSSPMLREIETGDHLAYFSNEFGLEIIVDSSLYVPKLKHARQFKYEIENENEEFLHYIDPCAFYGSLYNTKVFFKNNSATSNS